jgi:hypothetical protein
MPQFIQAPPNQQREALYRWMSVQQQQRYLEEQERARERAAQEQRTWVGVGAGLGAIGGLALAPAAVASSASTGAALTATGASATMTGLSYGLTGAAVGAQMGQQLGVGDYAGAVGTAAQTVQKVQQYQEDQAMYGYSPSQQERAMFARLALENGLDPGQIRFNAMQGGPTLPNAIVSTKIANAGDKELRDILDDEGIAMPTADYKALVATDFNGDSFAAIQAHRNMMDERELRQQEALAFAKAKRRVEGETAGHAQAMNMEHVPVEQSVQDFNELDKALTAEVQAGRISVKQYTDTMEDNPVQTVLRPRKKKSTQELAAEQLEVVQLEIPGQPGVKVSAIAKTLAPTPRNPEQQIEYEILDELPMPTAGQTFGEMLRSLKPTQRARLYNDAAGVAELKAEKGKPADIIGTMREAHDEMQKAMGAGAATGTDGPAPEQKVQQAYSALKEMRQKPPAQWTPQDVDRAGQLLESTANNLNNAPNTPEMKAVYNDLANIAAEVAAIRRALAQRRRRQQAAPPPIVGAPRGPVPAGGEYPVRQFVDEPYAP